MRSQVSVSLREGCLAATQLGPSILFMKLQKTDIPVQLYLLGPERTLSKINVLPMIYRWPLNLLSTSMSTQDLINLLSIKNQLSVKDSVPSLQNLNWENIDIAHFCNLSWFGNKPSLIKYWCWSNIEKKLVHLPIWANFVKVLRRL